MGDGERDLSFDSLLFSTTSVLLLGVVGVGDIDLLDRCDVSNEDNDSLVVSAETLFSDGESDLSFDSPLFATTSVLLLVVVGVGDRDPSDRCEASNGDKSLLVVSTKTFGIDDREDSIGLTLRDLETSSAFLSPSGLFGTSK